MMYAKLLNYYLEQQRWHRLSADEVRRRQVIKFRHLFEYARTHSAFYRKLYSDAGVENLEIRTFDDIRKVPTVDKQLMRTHATEEILTRAITPDLVKITTSGSTGEPFVIYQTRFEQYTSHLRVLGMLAALGYRPWHQILMLARLEPDAILPVERDLTLLPWLQKTFRLFRREILPIHTPPKDIVEWMKSWPDATHFWSPPGMMTILFDYMDSHDIRFGFHKTIMMADTPFDEHREKFAARMGGEVVSHYGMMECPTIAFDTGSDGRKRIFSNACMIELSGTDRDISQGELVITNLVNRTMPFIRYNTHDSAMALDEPDSPAKVIGPILGRLDDVLTLSSGEGFASCHAYALFMDFDECLQYKFVQTNEGKVILRLRAGVNVDRSHVREKAMARWTARYPTVPLQTEFVEIMPVDLKTGKFKNIERLPG